MFTPASRPKAAKLTSCSLLLHRPGQGRRNAGWPLPQGSDAPPFTLTAGDSGSAYSQSPSHRRAGRRHPPAPEGGSALRWFRWAAPSGADRRSAFQAVPALLLRRRLAVTGVPPPLRLATAEARTPNRCHIAGQASATPTARTRTDMRPKSADCVPAAAPPPETPRSTDPSGCSRPGSSPPRRAAPGPG